MTTVTTTEQIREFLNSQAGQALIKAMSISAPFVHPSKDDSEAGLLFRSGVVEGWRAAVHFLVSFGLKDAPASEERTVEYPPLDEDSAWPKDLGGKVEQG
jgi:hypothetical protein